MALVRRHDLQRLRQPNGDDQAGSSPGSHRCDSAQCTNHYDRGCHHDPGDDVDPVQALSQLARESARNLLRVKEESVIPHLAKGQKDEKDVGAQEDG